MAANVEQYFTPHHDPYVQRRTPASGGGFSLPMGADTGDMLVWNATTGAWEVLPKPSKAAILVADASGTPGWLECPASEDAVLISDLSAGTVVWLERPAPGGKTTYLTADSAQDDIHWEII